MRLPQKIPATVITGFLGAGKTSLIHHLLATARGRRLALVINEFGDLGVDRDILEGCGLEECADGDIVELSNGCICCTVADDFLPTIQTLIDRPDPPDHIVIETSGLALPKPLVKAFAWPEIKSRVTVDGVITVVDAAAVADGRFADDPAAVERQRLADPSLDHDNPLEEVFEDQLHCADMVVLNKSDLLSDAACGALTARLRKDLRSAVKVIRTSHGVVDSKALLGLEAAAESDLDARPSHHDGAPEEHDHDDFESFVIALGPVPDPRTLAGQLKALADRHEILRVKGFLDIPDKPLRLLIQGVGGRIQSHFDRPWHDDETRRSELVVIGFKGLDRVAIEAAMLASIGDA